MQARWLLFVGVWGCAHASQEGDPVVTVAASEGPAAAQPTKAAMAPGSCSLRADSWSPGGDGEGAPLSVGGLSLFAVHGGSLELKLGGSVAAGAVPVQVASGGVRLRGTIPSEAIGLYLKRPVVFEEAIIPTAEARLSWSGVDDHGIVVTHHLVGGVESDRLRASVPCRDLALFPEPFELPKDLYDAERGRGARLRDDRRVPLSTSPGSAPIAFIDLSRWEAEGWSESVRELSFDGRHSRIVWKRERELVFGWIPGDALLPGEEGYAGDGGGGYGYGMIGVFSGEEPPDERRRCKRDLELAASLDGGDKRPVGTLGAGAPFEVTDEPSEDSSHVSVWVAEIFDSQVVPQPGVEVWVRREELAGCDR